MISKRGSVIAAFVALSLTFAASSFAMMGGGGGHGTSSNRNYSDDHYRNYNNNRSVNFKSGVGRHDQGDTDRMRGSVRFEQNMDYQRDDYRNQYENQMDQNNPHYDSRNRGDSYLNHPGDGFDHHNF